MDPYQAKAVVEELERIDQEIRRLDSIKDRMPPMFTFKEHYDKTVPPLKAKRELARKLIAEFERQIQQDDWQGINTDIEHQANESKPQSDWEGINRDMEAGRENDARQREWDGINQEIESSGRTATHSQAEQPSQVSRPEAEQAEYSTQTAAFRDRARPWPPRRKPRYDLEPGLWAEAYDPETYIDQFSKTHPEYSLDELLSGLNLYEDPEVRGFKSRLRELRELAEKEKQNKTAPPAMNLPDPARLIDDFAQANPQYSWEEINQDFNFYEDQKIRDFKFQLKDLRDQHAQAPRDGVVQW